MLALVIMKIHQQQARNAMKESLVRQSLLDIVVPENEIIWIKKNKEILLQGKMFDIKTIILHNDGYHIEGLFDEQETELVELWHKEHSSGNEKGNMPWIAFTHLFYFYSNNCQEETYFSSTAYQHGERTWHLSTVDDPVLTPPPQNGNGFVL